MLDDRSEYLVLLMAWFGLDSMNTRKIRHIHGGGNMGKSGVVLLITAMIVLAGSLGTIAVNAVTLKPEAPPPLLAPPESVTYERLSPGDALLGADDGRPIAQLRRPPAEFGTVEVYLPKMQPWDDPKTEAYAVLASVRYAGSGGAILVTTAQPSPGARHLMTMPGEHRIQLGETEAWLSMDMGGDFPNRVRWIQDGLIITVAGDLPPGKLLAPAAQVTINK